MYAALLSPSQDPEPCTFSDLRFHESNCAKYEQCNTAQGTVAVKDCAEGTYFSYGLQGCAYWTEQECLSEMGNSAV